MEADTFPKLLGRSYEKYGDTKVALRQKGFGIWQEYTWKDYYEKVKYLSLGLISLGLEPGDKVSIVGENHVCWIFAMLATQAAGGVVACGVYPDSMASEFEYQIDHSDSTFVVAEDQEQVDKVLEVKDKLPKVKKVIYWDAKGMFRYTDPLLISLGEVLQLGGAYEKEHSGAFEQNVEKGNGDDVALLAYTSGTTGRPKGLMLLQRTLIRECKDLAEIDPTEENDEFLSFTPLAWPLDIKIFVVRHFIMGGVLNFPEKRDTVQDNLREIGFRAAFFAPRALEDTVRMIQVKMSDADPLKQLLYHLFLPVGFKMADLIINQERSTPFWKALYKLGDAILFGPLRDKVGFSKTKVIWTGGAAVSPDIFRYIMALGTPIKQLYGMTESGIVLMQRSDNIKLESAGTPTPGTEVRITDKGEIWLKTPCTMLGYHKNPEATADLIDSNGRVHTADAGLIDDEGCLTVIDRVKDLACLSDGTRFSPLYIENKLKFCPYIKDAVIVGDNKPYVAGIISIDFNYVGKWAENHRLAYTTYIDLSQKKEVYDLIQGELLRVNRRLPQRQGVRRFALLHKELDADDAELTRTKKLRRGFVAEHYKDLIEAIYSESGEYTAEASVRYRDGRTGTLRTAIRIASADANIS
ncbi:MAG: AMP-binding protein [Dehalococcoidia bacterium]|nr:AMP-binding protein [Dehalococcoidia bacterium]